MSDCGCTSNPTNQCACNIIWMHNTTVDTTTQPWDIIVSSPFYDVVSPDGSIIVMEVHNSITNTTRFEIFKACCPDRYVWACANDTNPWVLFDKLQVDTTWPLTYSLVNCPWDAHVAIWFDVSKLNAPDKRVAVDASCPWKYLEDALKIDASAWNYFDLIKTACELRFKPNPRELFRFDAINSTEMTLNVPWNATWFTFVDDASMNYDATDMSAVSGDIIAWGSYLTVTIPRTARYIVNMQGSYTSTMVHTVRNQICYVNGFSLWNPILDARDEGGWRKDLNADDLISTQTELNTWVARALHWDIPAADWECAEHFQEQLKNHPIPKKRVEILEWLIELHDNVNEWNWKKRLWFLMWLESISNRIQKNTN